MDCSTKKITQPGIAKVAFQILVSLEVLNWTCLNDKQIQVSKICNFNKLFTSFWFICIINILIHFSVMNNIASTSKSAIIEDTFTIIPSQRGGQLLLYDGYKYNFRRKNQTGHTVWVCSKKNICSALLVTNESAVVKQSKHNCLPEIANNEIKYRLSKCIERAKTETTPVPSIYADALEDMKDAGLNLLQKLPKYDSVKKTIYKHRNKALQAKRIRFTRIKDFVIPNIYRDFLLADFDPVAKNTRLFLFASTKGREMLKQAKEVYVDGTFKSAVPPFTQLFSLHVDLGITNTDEINIVPALYGLLPDKKQESYEIFFRLIKSQVPDFDPEIITSDFEVSIMNAVKEVYPKTRSQGCLFHFTQAVWRQAKKYDMTKTKLNKAHVRRCIALSYLPAQHRDDGWLYVLGECIKDKNTFAFNQYFEQTWIKNKRSLADKWCFYQVRNKTNNVTESWNSKLNKRIKPKPNIAQLLKTLTKDSDYYATFWKKNKYVTKKTNESIRRHQKLESSLTEYLDSEITLGHCIDKIALCLC